MKTYIKLFSLSLFLLTACPSLEAGWVIEKGKIKNTNEVATLSCEDHYSEGCHAYEKGDWELAETHFNIVAVNFAGSAFGQESLFFLGVCRYEQDELDLANDAFSEYLNSCVEPKYFLKTMEYKYRIANEFREGARRRPFGSKQMPKWLVSDALALKIYEEIILAVPCHDYAAYSLWAKALMLRNECQYQESVETFQALIRRFPKHELTPKAYLAINEVYMAQSEWEFQNPDLLQLAEINYKKFKKEFPRDERLSEAEEGVQALKETYASGLWRTAKFYEWQGECDAAVIYYRSAIKQFPETKIADLCKGRLKSLNYEVQ